MMKLRVASLFLALYTSVINTADSLEAVFTPANGGLGRILGASYRSGPPPASYMNARDMSPGAQANPGAVTVGQQMFRDFDGQPGYFYVWRSFLPFDTRGLPDNATITDARLEFQASYVAEDNDFQLWVVQSAQSNPTALTVHDYQRVGSTFGGQSANARQNPQLITLNSTGRDWINKTGWTLLALRSSREVAGMAPQDNNGNNWGFEHTGLLSNVRLVVQYDIQRNLTSLSVGGPSEVNEGDSRAYTCTAHYTDGFSETVPSGMQWSLSPASPVYATINDAGLLIASTLTADQTIYLTARYGGLTSQPPYRVTLKNLPGTVQSLTIRADKNATQIPENTTWQFFCDATLSDGTTKDYTNDVAWTDNSSYAEAGSSTGILTTYDVPSDQPCRITSTYNTLSANYDVTIRNTPPQAPTLVAPANGARVYSSTTTFRWTPNGTVTAFELDVQKIGGGYGHNPPAFPGTKTSEDFTSSIYPASFTWRVRAANGPGNWGPWSEVRTVHLTYPNDLANSVDKQPLSEEPVNLATGAYTYSRADLTISGRGLPFEFARFYNSGATDTTAMGAKWRHTYSVSLDEDGEGNVVIHWANNTQDHFVPDGEGGYENAFFGYSGKLTKNPDGTFDFETKSLITYHFDVDGKLLLIVDRNSNAIALIYDVVGRIDHVIDTVGRLIDFTYDANGYLGWVTDPLGRVLRYTHDANGDLRSFTDARNNTMTYDYDAAHDMTDIHDRRAPQVLVIHNEYGADGRVESQTNAHDKTWTFTYDPSGFTTETDPKGGPTTYHFDERRWVVKRTDALGNSEEYAYDSQGNRTSVKNARGYTTYFTYDGRGNVLTIEDAMEGVTLLEYNDDNQVTRVVDPLVRETLFEYDANGNVRRIIRPMEHITQFEYDAWGQVVRLIDAMGRVTGYTYDAQGNRDALTNALGETTTLEYDGVGRLLRITEPNGADVEFAYDPNDNLLSMKDQEDHETGYAYDENDNRKSVTNPKGIATQFTYTETNKLWQVIDAQEPPGVITFAYDELDRVLTRTDQRDRTITYEYDAVGNRKFVKDATPAQNATEFFYDELGNVLTVRDANNHDSQFEYDALDRLIRVTDALGNATQYAIDEVGRLTALTDADGRVSRYEYDALDRLITVTDDAAGTPVSAQYAYDLVGNRIALTDPNGNTSLFQYDALDRLLVDSDPLGRSTRYAYDNLGNLAGRTDARGILTTYTWSPAHRIESIVYPGGQSVAFDYDANGNRTQMTDSAGTTAWSFDDLDRIIEVTDPFGNKVGYGYHPDSRISVIDYDKEAPGTRLVNYEYDENGRMTTVTAQMGTPSTYTYTYDPAGLPIELLYPNGCKQKWSYFQDGRLQALTHEKADGTPFIAYTHQFDGAGNITGMDRKEAVEREFAPELTTYAYDAANQIKNANSTTFAFDKNGNQVREIGPSGTTLYNFDAENRLTAIDGPGAGDDFSFLYNGAGDRLASTRSGDQTRFLLDINKPLTDVLAETDASNAPQQFYIYGLTLLARVTPAGESFQYHPDHLESIMAVTDTSNSITATFAYDEFGAVASQTGSEESPWRFCGAGGLEQVNNSVYLVRSRSSNVQTGRFAAQDMVAFLGRTQSQNRYVYVLNNPLRLVDPSGMCAEEIVSGQASHMRVPIELTKEYQLNQDALYWRTVQFSYEAQAEILDKTLTATEKLIKYSLGSPAALLYKGLVRGGPAVYDMATGQFSASEASELGVDFGISLVFDALNSVIEPAMKTEPFIARVLAKGVIKQNETLLQYANELAHGDKPSVFEVLLDAL